MNRPLSINHQKKLINDILYSASAVDFLNAMMACVDNDFQISLTDNFDHDRFPDKSENEINSERQASFQRWLSKYYKELYQVFTLFNDLTSKILFQQLIRYRICGHQHVKLMSNNLEHWKDREQTKKIPCIPSKFQYPGQFGSLELCSLTWKGKKIQLHTLQLALAWYMSYRQYYYERSGIKIRPEKGDVIIDGGGCFGDSTVFFGLSVGETGKVYCFDFASEHIEIIQENIKINNMKNIVIVPVGLTDYHSEGKLVTLGKIWPGNRISFHDQPLPLTTLDIFVAERGVEKVDFIKLDIEGSEASCLKGSIQTIERFRPKLAISLYHQPNDLFEIPLWIREQFPDYKLYLDHYTIHEEETVLYAMSEIRTTTDIQESQ